MYLMVFWTMAILYEDPQKKIHWIEFILSIPDYLNNSKLIDPGKGESNHFYDLMIKAKYDQKNSQSFYRRQSPQKYI